MNFLPSSSFSNPTIMMPSGGWLASCSRRSPSSRLRASGSRMRFIHASCPPSCTHVGITPVKPVELALYVYMSAVICRPSFCACSTRRISSSSLCQFPRRDALR